MRATQVCPKCQGRKLYVVDPVRMPERDGNRMNVVTIPLTCSVVSGQPIEIGRLEAWVCATCSYVEYYAKDALKGLAAVAGQPAGNVRYIDGSGASAGPFR